MHASEPYDLSVKWRKRSIPPVIGPLVAAAVFLGLISGTGLVYDDREALGVIILGVTVSLVVLFALWAFKARHRAS